MGVYAQRHVVTGVPQIVERRQRDEDVVPDAGDVDDNSIGVLFQNAAREVRDHGRAGFADRRPAGTPAEPQLVAWSRIPRVWVWQIATASASATSWGEGTAGRPSSSLTMCCTCGFSARPY